MIGPGSDKNEHLVCVFLWMWMCVCVSIFCKWLREQLFMLISHQVLRAKLNSRIYMGCCNKWSENANHCQEFFTKTVEIRWILHCKFLAWKSGIVNFLTNIMSVRLTKKVTFWVLNVPMVKMLNWTKYFARSPLDFTRCSPTSWTKCSINYATSQEKKLHCYAFL